VPDLPDSVKAVLFSLFGVLLIKFLDFVGDPDRRRRDRRQHAREKCLEVAASLPGLALTAAAEGRTEDDLDPSLHAAICQLRIYGASPELLLSAGRIVEAFGPSGDAKDLFARVHEFSRSARAEFRTGPAILADDD
jgi:hypothetical protein